MSSNKSCNSLVGRSARGSSKNKLTGSKKLSPRDKERSRRSPSSSSRSSRSSRSNDEDYDERNRAIQRRGDRNNRRDVVKYGGRCGGRRSKPQVLCEQIIESETKTRNRIIKRVHLRYDDSDSSSDNSSTDESSSGCDDY
ncbi:uncharacterized protein LOC123305905 [Chrysoperla carnea]|uniref:uncharacterized protein LOC123305905 n=1 Tax=Chrysoperla carnea TaxID=189513 RepID=UPI001D09778E|nr:uncharacterized protein LOC123305905 [Chrysoperla carnea]